MDERRQDCATADLVTEALRMKRAFGEDAAGEFLRRHGVNAEVAHEALVDRYERRRVVRATGETSAPTPPPPH
jgi:hypothetical protein